MAATLLLAVLGMLVPRLLWAQTGQSENAVAVAYLLNIPKDYWLSVDVKLSATPANSDFSSAFLLVTSRSGRYSVTTDPFVQVGLIRDARRHFTLEDFVATRIAYSQVVYQEGEHVNEGWHQLKLTRLGGTLRLYVDGNRIFSSPESAFFTTADSYLYVQAGAELRSVGDKIDTEWRNFTESRDGVVQENTPSCFLDDRGLTFRETEKGEFAASGTFDHDGLSKLRGSCN